MNSNATLVLDQLRAMRDRAGGPNSGLFFALISIRSDLPEGHVVVTCGGDPDDEEIMVPGDVLRLLRRSGQVRYLQGIGSTGPFELAG